VGPKINLGLGGSGDVYHSFYARKRSWAVAEETREDVESSLRERGIADVRKREFHDALLRVAAADPEAVADAIVSARTED